jgi:hypothetical protein
MIKVGIGCWFEPEEEKIINIITDTLDCKFEKTKYQVSMQISQEDLDKLILSMYKAFNIQIINNANKNINYDILILYMDKKYAKFAQK